MKFSKHVRESEETAPRRARRGGQRGARWRRRGGDGATGGGADERRGGAAEEGGEFFGEARKAAKDPVRPGQRGHRVRSSSSQQRDAPTPGSGDVSSFANGANGYAVDLTDAVAAADCVSAINVDDESGTNGEKAPELWATTVEYTR